MVGDKYILKNEGAKLKVRLFIAPGIIMLTLCVLLVYFYTHVNVKTAVSGNNDLYSFGYVPYLDSFLYINMDGKVLSVTKNTNGSIPVIEGLAFDRFTVGSCLDIENENVFDAIAYLLGTFRKYEFDMGLISKIDVADLEDIHIYTKNVYVAFGSTQNADAKIRTLKEIIANLPIDDGVKGLLDVRVIGGKYIFKVLT